jgi:hypothetical protein
MDPSPQAITPETLGTVKSHFHVELSTRFLEHFSEQLYSSPQKAFEELISNGWDAGADCVDVHVATDLNAKSATLCVLDNGASMNEEGLKQLWHIAFSPKKDKPEQFGRKIIGKFGIGKLATYLLANKLTYICKAADGVIRRVTMDYSTVDAHQPDKRDKLISETELVIFEATQQDLETALKTVTDGEVLLKYLKDGLPKTTANTDDDEFAAGKSSFIPPPSNTWTLAVLSDLKPAGRELKLGILRRMLQAGLPFGCEMAIFLNGTRLKSSKFDEPLIKSWPLAESLGIKSIEVNLKDDDGSGAIAEKTTIPVTYHTTPIASVELPGLGRITGSVRLFRDPLSGTKSDERGSSIGFHINVLGRVVNQSDPSFGEKNLSHAAWGRFRMAVRADGLNPFLVTNREQFKQKQELKIFRAFLRAVFNKARTEFDSDPNAALLNGGDALLKSLGVLSLNPLRHIVSETLANKIQLPGLIDDSGIKDKSAQKKTWDSTTGDNIATALKEVRYEKDGDNDFVRFRVHDGSIVVNTEHPFVLEHSRTKAEKELLRTLAMISLLSDVYALDIGIDASALASIREYRDRLLRYKAMESRMSGPHIAKLLLETQHRSDQPKQLETVVADALRYIGFEVKGLGQSGEPEGVASAYGIPTKKAPSKEDPNPPLFTFTYDAKSSKHGTAQTVNINFDGVVEHRDRYKANFALVVAPGFSGEAVKTRSAQQKVTLLSAYDLGRLLDYTLQYGAIPFTKLREMFQFYDHELVAKWVTELGESMKTSRPLTIDIFIRALKHLKGKIPDSLPAATLALTCRETLGAVSVQDRDVLMLARGLSVLVPDLIGIDENQIIVNAQADHVARAIAAQLEQLHNQDATNAISPKKP